MRIFSTPYELMSEVARDLKELSVWVSSSTVQDQQVACDPQFDMRELINYSLCLAELVKIDVQPFFLIHSTEKWADEEFNERISRYWVNPGQAWKSRSEVWGPMLERNRGRFSYTYNERIQLSLAQVIAELNKHPTTRQAIISIWDSLIDIPKLGVDRVPCSMYYQFLIRESNKVSLIYNMRSSDFCGHFGNDVYLALKMLRYVVSELNWESNRFVFVADKLYMNVSSLHTFRKDSELLEQFMTQIRT